jgi:CBS domain-containing protein
MLAKEIMTTDVAFVTADAHVSDIARLLVEPGISAIPVVDADLRPIGMISESDLVGRTQS